jgi:secreted Zn-dependent insulinase-like peptidase
MIPKYDYPYTNIMLPIVSKKMLFNYYDHNDIIDSLKDLTYDKFINIIKQIFNTGYIIFYGEGNINKNILLEIKDLTNGLMKIVHETNLGCSKLVKDIVEENKNYKYIEKSENILETNKAIHMCFPIGYIRAGSTDNWANIKAISNILTILINREYFDDLRTKQQLGYIIKFDSDYEGDIKCPYMLFKFIIQSNHKDCEYLFGRTNDFIIKFKKTLDNISNKDIKIIKHSIIEKLETPFQTILESSLFNFDIIISSQLSLTTELELCYNTA